MEWRPYEKEPARTGWDAGPARGAPEHARDTPEQARDAQEHTRDDAEHARDAPEHARDAQEHTRDDAEHTRDTPEQARDDTEHARDEASGQGGARHRPHGPGHLCAPASALYARALRAGRVHGREAEAVPCLVDFGLLHPDPDDLQWLLPSEPAGALLRLLRGFEEEVGRERRREAELTAAFTPLLGLSTGAGVPRPYAGPGTALHGVPGPLRAAPAPCPERTAAALDEAASRCAREVLTIQPGGFRPVSDLGTAPSREQALLSRGCRMRTLYQHTTRHALPVIAHFERLEGDVEVRTLSEVPEQLVVFDRTVAFVPGAPDFSEALEIRTPAVVGHLAALFDRLWRLATPMYPHPAAPQPTRDGVTARQRTIAELLVEGLTDAGIADRLGMNVRTVRVHIAKLARTLGSTGRTQLGYLIGRSGILGPGCPN
ncbi:helix-turn-helix transcriptional regulator [Streptomyces aureocirculatus]|uniref:helix-turn-helix transcriptional regulator n=1 Tax=Streptomyces aureocirculatus TaxID=67275 RepID=UPI00298D6DAF|nr:LuxR C-terminal-related transcriptional regulator [Streptomyces aureocirculatus]